MRALMALPLLCACALQPARNTVPVVLQPFAEAAQFLAPGFQSYSFSIDRDPDFDSEVERWLQVLVARSGSDFQKPKDLGAGRCRGVEVRDYGAVRVPVSMFVRGEPTTHIDGVPVWLGQGDGVHFDRTEPLWVAVVDARFHISSHDRGKLEAALQRTRSELIERTFAHVCETGRGRRSWIRGMGTPRGWGSAASSLVDAFGVLVAALVDFCRSIVDLGARTRGFATESATRDFCDHRLPQLTPSSMGY